MKVKDFKKLIAGLHDELSIICFNNIGDAANVDKIETRYEVNGVKPQYYIIRGSANEYKNEREEGREL